MLGLEELITDVGRWLPTLHRQLDGSWKVAVDIRNSNLPVD